MKTQTTLTNGGNVKQKVNKPELSAADKKLIAEYAAKAAVLREHAKALSAQRKEKLDAYEALKAQRSALLAEKNPENHEEIVAIYREEEKIYIEAEAFSPRIKKFNACRAQFIHAAAIVVAEFIAQKYKTAKIGPKTRDKMSEEAREYLAEFGEISLYINREQVTYDTRERWEARFVESRNYSGNSKVNSLWRDDGSGRIFPLPKPPKADTPERVNEYFRLLEQTNKDFEKVKAAFSEWKERNAEFFKMHFADFDAVSINRVEPEFLIG